MTLTGIAADVRAKDHGMAGLSRRVLAVAAMFGGGACGALLVLHAGATAALGLAVGLLAVVTAGATLAAGKPGAWWTAEPLHHSHWHNRSLARRITASPRLPAPSPRSGRAWPTADLA